MERYSLNRMLDGITVGLCQFGEEEKLFPLPVVEPRTVQPEALSPYRLRYLLNIEMNICTAKQH